MRNVFNYLLVSLCIADLFVILSSLVYALKTLNKGAFLLDELDVVNDGVSHITISISIFLTMALTIERYFAICSAFTYQARVAKKGPFHIFYSYIFPAVFCALILNIPKILSIANVVNIDDMSPDMKSNYIRSSITYQIIHPLTTTCIIPIIVLTVLNIKIFIRSNRINSSRIKSDKMLTKVMMVMVGVFIALSIPKMSLALFEVSTIPNILECFQRSCKYYISSGRWVADIIIRYLFLLNSCVNFIIYCFTGANFRRVLVAMFSE